MIHRLLIDFNTVVSFAAATPNRRSLFPEFRGQAVVFFRNYFITNSLGSQVLTSLYKGNVRIPSWKEQERGLGLGNTAVPDPSEPAAHQTEWPRLPHTDTGTSNGHSSDFRFASLHGFSNAGNLENKQIAKAQGTSSRTLTSSKH